MIEEWVPDSIEPIRAWRVWSKTLDGDILMLSSVGNAFGGVQWQPGEALEAQCPTGAHAAPALSCSCGVYALKSRDAALEIQRRNSGVVLGEVELWGRIIEHEHGFRAQHARIARLWNPVSMGSYQQGKSVVSGLAESEALTHYGAPVTLYDSKTNLPVDLDALRHVFVPNSRPQVPLRQLIPKVALAILRAFLIVGSVILAFIAGAAGVVGGVLFGVFLPVAVAVVMYRDTGANPPASTIMAMGAGLTVIATYVAVFLKRGIYKRMS